MGERVAELVDVLLSHQTYLSQQLICILNSTVQVSHSVERDALQVLVVRVEGEALPEAQRQG
jgi:hypothetical protein